MKIRHKVNGTIAIVWDQTQEKHWVVSIRGFKHKLLLTELGWWEKLVPLKLKKLRSNED